MSAWAPGIKLEEQAYAWATRDLAASEGELQALLSALKPFLENPWDSSMFVTARRMAAQAFERNVWGWPAYDRFVREGYACPQVLEVSATIGQRDDAAVLAEGQKLIALKLLAKELGIDIKGLRKSSIFPGDYAAPTTRGSKTGFSSVARP